MMSHVPSGFNSLRVPERDFQLLRIAALAELDAINLYRQLASLAESRYVRDLLNDVAHEEEVHLSEFYISLRELSGLQAKAEEEAISEICDIAKHTGRTFAICSPHNI